MKKLKQIGFFFLFLILVITISPASAQAPSETQTQPQAVKQPVAQPVTQATTLPATTTENTTLKNEMYKNLNPDVSHDLHTLSQNVIIEVLSSTVCILSGRDPLNPAEGKCLGIDTSTGKLGYTTGTQGGAVAVMGNLMGGTFSIPVSGAGYAQYAADNFGITKKAYAQSSNGIGYDRLRPLLGIWTKLRDISYLMFVLAFTVIGLAIMFRVKIDARTVMTIQNQIPKIVIALVLVTFSYAIAGFMIDIMYILIYLLVSTANTLTPVNINVNENVFGVVNKAFNVNALNFTTFNTGIIGISGDVALSVASVFTSMAGSFLDSVAGTIFKILFTPFTAIAQIGCGAFGLLDNTVGKIPFVGGFFSGRGQATCDFVDTFYRTVIGAIFGILAFLIVLIAILFTLFRVWFLLVRSFAYVIIDSLIAPLWITMGIFPGSKLSFGSWFRHLAGHLSVFPMTFAIILFGKTIMDAMGSGSTLGGVVSGGPHELFNPPLIGDAVSGSNAIAAFIGFGFILSMPTILERTKKAVGAMDFGLKDIGKSIGVGTGVGRAGISTATGDESHWSDKKGGFATMGKPKQFLKNMGIGH